MESGGKGATVAPAKYEADRAIRNRAPSLRVHCCTCGPTEVWVALTNGYL